MSRIVPLLLLLLVPAVRAQTPAEAPVRTLKQAYELALKNSDSVAISEQAIRRAEALYRAAFGGSLPVLSARSDTSWQDKRSSPPSTQTDAAFRLSWSGLTGYRELAAVRGSKAVTAQRESEKARAEQLLLGDVAAAYYGLLQSRANAETTGRLIEFADKRLSELKERVRVGRAREADALAQEVQSQSLRSQLEESSRLARARADLLEFLVRAPVAPEADDAAVPGTPGPLESYLARIESRPDVAAARESVRAADAAAAAARADFLPAVTAQANRYLYRPAIRDNNKWDASVGVSLPIFSFGAIRASVAAARAAATSEGFELRAARRAADLDTRNSHRDYETAVRQLEIRRRGSDLAKRDYSLQTADEKRGLVTAIEVLQSLDRLNTANLELANALLGARLSSINLELSAGARPEDLLK